MHARKMLFAAILFICALSSKKILIYNEEMIVACCFIGFIILSRKSLGNTFKVTLDGRIQAIQEESQLKRKKRALFIKLTFFLMLVVLFFLFSWWAQEWEFFGMVSTRVGRALFIKGVSSLMPEVWISCGASFVASALGGALISCMEGGVPLPAGTSGAGSSGAGGMGELTGMNAPASSSGIRPPFDLNMAPDPEPEPSSSPGLKNRIIEAELEEAQKELRFWEEKGRHYFKEEARLYRAGLEGEKMEKEFYSLERRVENLRLEHRRLLSLIASRRG